MEYAYKNEDNTVIILTYYRWKVYRFGSSV